MKKERSLSIRAQNVLNNNCIRFDPLSARQSIASDIQPGIGQMYNREIKNWPKLSPIQRLMRFRNCGRRTAEEILTWCGLEDEIPKTKKSKFLKECGVPFHLSDAPSVVHAIKIARSKAGRYSVVGYFAIFENK